VSVRALKVLVVAMGVLIVFGTVGLVAALVHRATSERAPAGPVSAALPAGAELRGVGGGPEGRVVLWLVVEGESRVLTLDARGRVVGEVRIAR
jgi:hypothetical protein